MEEFADITKHYLKYPFVINSFKFAVKHGHPSVFGRLWVYTVCVYDDIGILLQSDAVEEFCSRS